MKTITLDEEAYRLLRGAKRSPKESFSSVVKRRFGDPPDLRAAFGGWSGVPDERIARLKRERVAVFGTTDTEG